MAEFCRKCAHELGMYGYDRPPLFCEHCKKYKISNWQKLWNWFKLRQ